MSPFRALCRSNRRGRAPTSAPSRQARSSLVSLALDPQTDASTRRRALHTLKGNALLFGMSSVAEQCHLAESALSERAECGLECEGVARRWSRISSEVESILGSRRGMIEISPEQLEQLNCAAAADGPRGEIVRLLAELPLEPVE